MDKLAHFRNLREEDSSGIPGHWICTSIIRLLSAIQTAQNNCKPFELELLINNGRVFFFDRSGFSPLRKPTQSRY